MTKQAFRIANMHCAMCSMTIDHVLEDLPGVEAANTSYARGRTEVTYDPERLSTDALIAAMQGAGYEASVIE